MYVVDIVITDALTAAEHIAVVAAQAASDVVDPSHFRSGTHLAASDGDMGNASKVVTVFLGP